MIEHFRDGDIVRIVALSGLSVDEDPSLVGSEAVFSFYSRPNEACTGWEVVVDTADDDSPTGWRVWVLEDRGIEPTGFRVDHVGHRRPIGLRTPEVAGDVVSLRLASSLTTDSEAVAFQRAVRECLSQLVAREGLVIVVDRRREPDYEIELYVSLRADDGADALFDAVVGLCPTGWDSWVDDGWRRDCEWERARAAVGDVFIHPEIYYAEVTAEPWSRPARRNVATD